MISEPLPIGINDQLDEEGFLRNPEFWNREVARLLANGEADQGLTEDHWKVIEYLRDYYCECGCVPPVKMLSSRTGFSFKHICSLFPSGLTRGACRIAGIPKATIKPSFHYP
jgi:dissimilatory sulfite reductase related protein